MVKAPVGNPPTQFERPIFLGHRKERIRNDVGEGVHPPMQITLQRYADLRFVERLRDWLWLTVVG